MARFAVWTRPRASAMLSPQTMRIAAIDPLVVHVPLRAPVQGVHGETTVQQSVLVRVTEADGLEGWGDVDPTPGYSLASAVEIRDDVSRLVPTLLGGDALNVHKALAAMDAALDGAFQARRRWRWRCGISRAAPSACRCTRCWVAG